MNGRKNGMGIHKTAFITACLLFGLVNGAKASVISVADGYEVSYGINMNPGSSNGSDIQNTFIFEWDDSNFNVDYAYTIAGQGTTNISHIIDFAPASALLGQRARRCPPQARRPPQAHRPPSPTRSR